MTPVCLIDPRGGVCDWKAIVTSDAGVVTLDMHSLETIVEYIHSHVSIQTTIVVYTLGNMALGIVSRLRSLGYSVYVAWQSPSGTLIYSKLSLGDAIGQLDPDTRLITIFDEYRALHVR